MVGEYFSSSEAEEVILHEYLLYQWGLISTEEQQSVIGKTLTLSNIENSETPSTPRRPFPIPDISSDLSKEEQEAL